MDQRSLLHTVGCDRCCQLEPDPVDFDDDKIIDSEHQRSTHVQLVQDIQIIIIDFSSYEEI